MVQVAGQVDQGCAGSAQTLVGQFAVVVRLASGNEVRTDLNALMDATELRFPVDSYHDRGLLEFADYNHDGHPDFTLTPWTCGNNERFYFFTVEASGHVAILTIDPKNFVSAQEIVRTRAGFRSSAYDNSIGKSIISTYVWSKIRLRFELTQRAFDGKPIPTPPA